MSAVDSRRATAAIVVALAALAAVTLAALGPALPDEVEYSWPPDPPPISSPTRTWLSPLLLARHEADTIRAHVPCQATRVLRDAGSSILLFGTARAPTSWNGLAVTRPRVGGATVVAVGRDELVSIPAPRPGASCALEITVEGRNWKIEPTGRPARSGTLESRPTVTGLFTELDLRSNPGLDVTVRPIAQDTRPSDRQTLLRLVAALLLAAAVVITVWPDLRHRRWGGVRRNRQRFAAQDGVVVVLLAVWWMLAPLNYDDGWVRARQLNSLISGGFSSYYEHWGTNLPLAAWFEWVQHLVVGHTSSLAADRLPTAALLVATWIVARRCLTRTLGRGPARRDVAWWSAALTFCVGATAYGMTLRPEPVIVLLAVGVLAVSMQYAQTSATSPLFAAVLLGGLAVTVHPAGVVALAPLVVCLPRIVRDAKRGVLPLSNIVTVALVGLAWTVLLAFLDSDLSQRRESTALLRNADSFHSKGVFQELERYGNLSGIGSSVLRREFVAILLLAVVAFVAGTSGRRSLTERLPSASIVVGLALLAFVPSKWIWHFGVLVGIATIAVGVESDRLVKRESSPRRALAVTATVMVFSLWAGLHSDPWGPLDVGATWSRAPALFVSATIGTIAIVIALGLAGRIRRPEMVVFPAVAAALLAVTVATIGAAAVVTDGWTATRQALASIAPGDTSCGVGDDLRIPTLNSMTPLLPVGGVLNGRTIDSRGQGTRDLLSRRPTSDHWYRLRRPVAPIGFFVSSRRRPSDHVVVAWGRLGHGGVETLRTGIVDLPTARHATRWTFVLARSFPKRPRNANAISIAVRRQDARTSTTAVTRPMSFHWTRLSRVLTDDATVALVDPFVFEATPCARLPAIAHGVAQAPNLIVEWPRGPNFANYSSPFRGVVDALDTVSVPMEGLAGGGGLVVHWVIAHPRDAVAPMSQRSVN